MIEEIIRKILANEKLHNWLKKIYHRYAAAVVHDDVVVDIPEISALAARESPIVDVRLNLLIPALSLKHVFGGISTALNFFHELLPEGMDGRIIITDEAGFIHENNTDYLGWRLQTLEDDDCKGLSIVCAGDRYNKKIPLRKKDVIIASAWWTAIIAEKLVDAKRKIYKLNEKDKFIYLIQDFEPGFYSWSTRYSLAESTYHSFDDAIAVFNTSVLKDYFDLNGYKFTSAFVFEPVLNAGLRQALRAPIVSREPKIIVYGRPGVSRNVFELLIMSLRLAVSNYDLSGWKFYSAGESHSKIDLGHNCELLSLGKLSLSEYGDHLNSAYIGISLMVSPHPSYPPLEMAAFGVKVITNNYANKRLSNFSKNIFSVDFLSPESVADMLIKVVNKYDPFEPNINGETSEFMLNFINNQNPFEKIILEIRAMVFQ